MGAASCPALAVQHASAGPDKRNTATASLIKLLRTCHPRHLGDFGSRGLPIASPSFRGVSKARAKPAGVQNPGCELYESRCCHRVKTSKMWTVIVKSG